MLNDLHNRHVLGKVIAFVYVIKFQKRGMPHSHILEILDETDRIYDVDMYDQIVCCEIPNIETESNLYWLKFNNIVFESYKVSVY